MNVSVIIPTKNRKNFLRRALESVIVQLRELDEVIIVDDASDSPNYDFITDSRVTIVYNNKSLGGAKARNIGVEKAKNDILMFLDDDDAWESQKIDTQLKLLENKDVSIVYSGKKVVWDDSLDKVVRNIDTVKKNVSTIDLCQCNYVGSTSTVAIRKSDFVTVGGFDENLECFQDFDLWLRLSKFGYAISDQRYHVVYTIFRKHGMQISRAVDGRHERAAKYLKSKYSSELDSKQIKLLDANLKQLVSKALNHSNPFRSLYYSLSSVVTSPSLRGVKFTLASLASIFGYKHG
ncbi:glycosyltransferase family 2 protein [Vibrio fluvialis]|nr:glycosyltransferase family 2 protein [Vibrio fluvialis]